MIYFSDVNYFFLAYLNRYTKVKSDLKLSTGKDIEPCSGDYLRVWMGLPAGDKIHAKYPVARVESIEILWHLPGANKPALLPVTFPVPTGFLLLRKETLNEVTDSLQPGNQKRKLQQLMEQFRFLLGDVKMLQLLNQNVITAFISNPKVMTVLNVMSFATSLIIITFLLFSLVRRDNEGGGSDFFAQGKNIDFDLFWLQQELGGKSVTSSKQQAWLYSLFFMSPSSFYRNFFSVLKVLQVGFIILQLVVYLIVNAVPDFERENRNVISFLYYRGIAYYAAYTTFAALAFFDQFICLTVVIVILEFIKRSSLAEDVYTAIFGTRGNRGGLKLLSSTLLMLVIFCLAAAMIMFSVMPHDVPDEDLVCQNYLSCALLMMNTGLRNGGGIGESMWVYNFESQPGWWVGANGLFNFLLFLVVNAILLNVVFGIIIDSFADRREKQSTAWEAKMTICAICGIKNSKFVPPNSFEKHFRKEVRNRIGCADMTLRV